MIAQSLNRLAVAALDQLYPPQCALCEEQGPFLCDACLAKLTPADGARCDVCWLPGEDSPCPACAAFPPPLARLRSVFRYEGEVRELVHAFKFDKMSALGRPLAEQLARCYRRHGLAADVIVPVPLSRRRGRYRGFNQAELMARELAREISIEFQSALLRVRHTSPQALSSSSEKRHENVRGSFAISSEVYLRGKHALLIDDVATTGATLNECARVLLQSGAATVIGLTLSRAD